MSINSLNNLSNKYPEAKINIYTLSEIVPKFTFLCIDNRQLFITPYYTSAVMASAWVIETHAGDKIFEAFKKDLDNLLRVAEPWKPAQIVGDRDSGLAIIDPETTLPELSPGSRGRGGETT